MLNHYPYPKEFKATKRGLPTVFYVETVLACNLKCPECAIGSSAITDRKKGLMTCDDFNIIWSKIKPYAKLVYLHKWGEPTMNPNISYFISEVSKSCHSHIMTNGVELNEEKISSMINSGLGSLIFSVDGVTQNVYEKYRIGGNCEKVWHNIQKARDIINRNGAQTDLIAQFIVFRHNEHELDTFIEKCKTLNIKYHIRTAYIRFGSIDIPKSTQHRRKIYSSPKEHEIAIKACPSLNFTMTITVDGSILLCSQDYNNQFNLGNVFDKNHTLESLWNSPKYMEFRKSIKAGSFPKLCIDNCTIYPKSY